MEIIGTSKQKRALAIMGENSGISSAEAMIRAGYSPATARNPQKLTTSKAFAKYSDSIPDNLVRSKHLALLKKKDKDGNIDVVAVKAGVEMAYKIKGYFAPEQQTNIGEVVIASFRSPEDIPSKLLEHDNGTIQEEN